MIHLGRRHGWWLIALATFALVAGLRALGQWQPLEHAFADQRARWLQREVSTDIVIVAIDAASLAALDQWPWPRRHHATLVERLTRAAPRSVFLDIDFSTTSNALDDAMLESALAKPRDFPIALPVYFQQASANDPTLVLSQPRMRFARRTEYAVVNALPASDGLTRSWRTSWTIDGKRAPSIIDPARRLPDDHDVYIDYSISPASFRQVSFVDVIEGRVPRETFAGKTVFVGATSLDLNDLVPVPVHGSLPGVIVQALAAETVTQGAPVPAGAWTNIALLAAWAVLGALLFNAGRSKWYVNFAFLVAADVPAPSMSTTLRQSICAHGTFGV